MPEKEILPDPVATPAAPPITASELTAPLAAAMPPPSETTLPEETPAATPPAPEGPKDTRGTVFDPARHMAKPDGTPAKNRHGRFYSKDIGHPGKTSAPARPAKPAPVFNGPAPSRSSPPPHASTEFEASSDPANQIPRALPVVDQYDLLADVYLRNGYGPLMLAFGEEILPDSEEHLALKNSLAAWLRIRRAKEFSPGLAFAMTAGAIFMKKLEKPTVRERAGLLWHRTKQVYHRYFPQKEN